ncbi:Spy/CpxP family protein refolding chaperone [Aquibium sp. ELW1220]|uniref:Spy/CpxP family protein refolding chaperone n=1 Tax=Aquibium sp. ELW1220 TaxID=2976766 RepID=UPI0025B15231|nr:Spy/CpxP family protein refolding chaperone [Aquibium sp. ELW1220]MDN2581965.1 Spy/CpxP family protein refolding chaperone [Aquibium sp. ELW1220]
MDKNVFDQDQTTVRETVSAPAWRRPLTIGAAVVAVVAGIGFASAQGQEFGSRFSWDDAGPGMHHGMVQKAGWGWGGDDGDRGMGRHGGGMHGIGRVMDEIDATPEQEKKLFAIFDGVRGEMRDTMIDFRSTRGEVLDILGAATIDRDAVEKLRAQRVAAMDAASKTITAALVEAAEVLTPEQRAKLAAFIEERGEGRRGGFGRW